MSKRAGGTFVAEAAAAMLRGGTPDERCPPRRGRSVTASAQALDHSLPGRPESSFPPLGLLFPTRTASLGSCGGPESGAYPAPVCRDGACPRPRAATRAAPTARVEDSCRGPMRAGGELPHRGKRGRPGVSAPTLGQPAELSRRGGACPRPRAATRAAPTARVEDSCRGPMRAGGELPRRGKRGRPGVPAPALGPSCGAVT